MLHGRRNVLIRDIVRLLLGSLDGLQKMSQQDGQEKDEDIRPGRRNLFLNHNDERSRHRTQVKDGPLAGKTQSEDTPASAQFPEDVIGTDV
jgi:hypothetical protein